MGMTFTRLTLFILKKKEIANMNIKTPASKQIAIAMTRKMFIKFEELSKAPKLTPEELKELIRLRKTLAVLKQVEG